MDIKIKKHIRILEVSAEYSMYVSFAHSACKVHSNYLTFAMGYVIGFAKK